MFPKDRESNEIKNEPTKIKDKKIKLLEIICFMIQASSYLVYNI